MATVTFHIPDDLDLELERQSSANSISKSDLARQALQRYLWAGRLRALRSELVPLAQVQNIHSDEDVFHALDKP